MSFRSLKVAQSPNRGITEHRLDPPSMNILFNPGSQNFPCSGVKKAFYGAECFGRPVLIAATVRHFRIINSNIRHDPLRIAKHPQEPRAIGAADRCNWASGFDRKSRQSFLNNPITTKRITAPMTALMIAAMIPPTITKPANGKNQPAMTHSGHEWPHRLGQRCPRSGHSPGRELCPLVILLLRLAFMESERSDIGPSSSTYAIRGPARASAAGIVSPAASARRRSSVPGCLRS